MVCKQRFGLCSNSRPTLGGFAMPESRPDHEVTVARRPNGAATEAQVSYAFVSLSPEGNKYLVEFFESYYRSYIESWRTAIEHYLTTGTLLKGH